MPEEVLHLQTPVLEHRPLSRKLDKTVLLKMECFQPVGSFKIRGIGCLCRQEVMQHKISHLISSSGGNAGYAVAYAGRRLGAAVTVVVPETTPQSVRKRIGDEDARVIVQGSVWDEAHHCALSLAQKENTAYIPPFDHPVLWKGHATLVDECAHQCEKPDAIILSVGGGGLLCGVLEGLHNNNGWDDVPVIAVETEGTASFHASVAQGELVTLDAITSIAGTLGAKQVTRKALEWSRRHEIQSVVVTDRAAANACLKFADDLRMLVEPSCGASLSIVYDNWDVIQTARTVLVIVCGGIGVTLEELNHWKSEFRL